MKSRGFSTVEAAVIIVVLAALGSVGFWVFNRQSSEKSQTPSLSQGESVDAPAAPEVNSAGDLDTVVNTLDAMNLEASNSDNSELDTQANGF
jgi:hypothetical protein